jgi:hypothetical protein
MEISKWTIYRMTFGVGFLAILMALMVDSFFHYYAIPNQRHFSNTRKIDRIISEKNPDEIPIFGSSVARRGYYCDSISPDVYNYGMSGSLFNSIYPLMQIEMEKEKETPVILDFDHHTFLYSEYLKLDLSNYVPHIENHFIRDMLEEHGKYDWNFQVPGLRYFGLYMDYTRDFLKPKLETEELINCGGVFYPPKEKVFLRYLAKREEMIKEKDELVVKKKLSTTLFNNSDARRLNYLEALFTFHPDSTNVAKFETLMRENRHRQFFIVYSPQNWSKIDALVNYDEVIEFLGQLERDNENLKVFDYSLVEYPDSYYRDSGHMNILGAKAFSAMLGRDLRSFLKH